jgi:hypothetical protein
MYQNGETYSKMTSRLPNGHKMYQRKYIKILIPRPSEIDPNWDFWYENLPSGNPVAHDKKL